MKRILSILLSMLLLLSLAACGDQKEKDNETDSKLYKEIKKAYNAFKDEGGTHSENCMSISKYVFYDGDEYYRVKGETTDLVKSKNVGNPAAHGDFEGYEVYFYESSANNDSLKAEIKNVYCKFVADMALSNYIYNAIEDYIYFDGTHYYQYDGSMVCVCRIGAYVASVDNYTIYENNG